MWCELVGSGLVGGSVYCALMRACRGPARVALTVSGALVGSVPGDGSIWALCTNSCLLAGFRGVLVVYGALMGLVPRKG